MSAFLFIFILIATLATWGNGTIAAVLALIAALAFSGIESQSPGGIATILLVGLSGQVIARTATAFLSSVFPRRLPASFSTMAAAGGYLLVLENPHTLTLLGRIGDPSWVVSVSALVAFVGDMAVAASVIAALALVFAALIEIPFSWVFRDTNAPVISWVQGMRPILLVMFLGISIAQAGTYISEMLDTSLIRLSGEVSGD